MDIQKRINKLGGHFIGMNVAENIIYLEIGWPQHWVVSETTEYNFGVRTAPLEEHYGYYFFANMEVGFDKIFDAVEYNIEFNRMAEEKVSLLKTYIEQLKDIFEVEDVDTLKTLKFNYKQKKGKPKKKVRASKVEKPNEETRSDETVNEKGCLLGEPEEPINSQENNEIQNNEGQWDQ